MRMPPGHLVADRGDNVLKVELSLIGRNLTVKHDLQQEIAKFIAK